MAIEWPQIIRDQQALGEPSVACAVSPSGWLGEPRRSSFCWRFWFDEHSIDRSSTDHLTVGRCGASGQGFAGEVCCVRSTHQVHTRPKHHVETSPATGFVWPSGRWLGVASMQSGGWEDGVQTVEEAHPQHEAGHGETASWVGWGACFVCKTVI